MEKMKIEVIKNRGKKIYKDDRCTYIMLKGMRLTVDEKKLRKN